jgi:hypothetical protein
METLKYDVVSGGTITYTTRSCHHALEEFTACSALFAGGEIKREKPIDKLTVKSPLDNQCN